MRIPPAVRARRLLAATLIAAGALLTTLVVPAPAGADDASAEDGRPVFDLTEEKDDEHPQMASTLEDELARSRPSGGRRTPAPVTVVVEADDPAAAAASIAASGGEVTDVVGSSVQAEIPPASLGTLAEAPGVAYVREPYLMQPDAIVSEGVAQTGAAAWQAGGEDGAGVKIAVVDVGFAGMLEAGIAGELPAGLEIDDSRCDDPAASDHGTAVAELVHDTAPGAQLLLVCVDTDIDFAAAMASMPSQGVDIVNGSIGAPLSGRGDGRSGAAADAVAQLRRAGVLYVAAAGNYGTTHYHATAGGDADGPGLDDVASITPTKELQVTVAPWEEVALQVKWDQWGAVTDDFDVYAYNQTCGLTGSEDEQIHTDAPPVELALLTNCTGSPQVFSIVVNHFEGTGQPRMDFFLDGAVMSMSRTTESSVSEPATSPWVLTVGSYCAASGAIESFSGRGPTIDGRVKPDLIAPDGVSTLTYGPGGCASGFLGTSAAAPQVAGAAALLLGANPDLDVVQLQQAVLDRALDRGTLGRDAVYGSGYLRMGPMDGAPAATPEPLTAVAPRRWFDSRPGPVGVGETSFGPTGRTIALSAGQDLAIPMAGVGGVPADATAVVLNVTAIASSTGWITVHPEASVPTASNLNLAPGQVAAVHVTATIGSDGKVRFFNSHGSTDLVIDLAGWYGPTGAGNGLLTSLPQPGRAFDSRPGGSGYGEAAFGPSGRTTPVGAGQTVDVQVAGLGGIAADADAVVMNLTATSPTADGWLTVYPTGSPAPLASAINFAPGQTVANLVVVPVGPGGMVTVANARGSTDVVLDVIGAFSSTGEGAGYVAMDPPSRILDTRFGNGWGLPVFPGSSADLVLSDFSVPASAVAVQVSLTVVYPTEASWFTLDGRWTNWPMTSNLNFAAGQTVANASISTVGRYGTLHVLNARGMAHGILDLAGYFAPVPRPTT